MKPLFILLILNFFLCLSTDVIAQGNLTWSFGINLSKTENIAESFGTILLTKRYPIIYPYGGIGYRLDLSDKFVLSCDSQISTKGYREKGIRYRPDATNYKRNQIFVYLDLIPKLNYKLSNSFSVGFGVSLGLKLLEAEIEKFKVDNEKIYNYLDFGYVYSLSYKRNKIQYQLHYNYGVRPTKRLTGLVLDQNLTYGYYNNYNRTLQLGILINK